MNFVANRSCDRDQQAGWCPDFRRTPGRSSFARFSVEFRALERPIRRMSVGRFPESRDKIKLFPESPLFRPPFNICLLPPLRAWNADRLRWSARLIAGFLRPTERRKRSARLAVIGVRSDRAVLCLWSICVERNTIVLIESYHLNCRSPVLTATETFW